MKRILSILLALTMMFSIAACTANDDTYFAGENDSDVVNDADNVDSDEELEVEEVFDDVSDSFIGEQVTIDETVLVDEADIKITASELVFQDTFDNLFSAYIELLIENNSDKDLYFKSSNASVNGYMITTAMSVDVAAGKKADAILAFDAVFLDLCGIETIADMEFAFCVDVSGDWEEYLYTDQIKLKTSAAEGFEYSYDDEGTVVYEDNEIKIVSKGLIEDYFPLGTGIVLYIYNYGENAITIYAEDASVNGFVIDSIFDVDVLPGKHAVSAMTFYSSELEGNGITDISDVELSFRIFDSESWDTIEDTEKITLTF